MSLALIVLSSIALNYVLNAGVGAGEHGTPRFLSRRDIFDSAGACVQVIGARDSVVAVLVVSRVVEALC